MANFVLCLLVFGRLTNAFRTNFLAGLSTFGVDDVQAGHGNLPNYTISMPVDHFNESDTRTFKNRYWINDTYYKPGGPVFFWDFGESGVIPWYISMYLQEGNNTNSAVMALARKFNGLAVGWEHRFYGESQPIPFAQTSFQLPYEDLRYLTVEQALEDTVYFANHFQPPNLDAHWEQLSPNKTAWVWVGGSYPGARGAWARIRNPEIWYSTWASSAVVEEMVDGSSYFDAIYRAMERYNPTCLKDWKAVVDHVNDLETNGPRAEKISFQEKLEIAYAVPLNSGLDLAGLAHSGDELDAFDTARFMEIFFEDNYQSQGFNKTLRHTCNYMESYVPAAQKYNGSNSTLEMISILKNPDNAGQSAQGIVASAGIQAAVDAYLFAVSKRWGEVIQDALTYPRDPFVTTSAVGWIWQECSELGLWQVSKPQSPHNLIGTAINLTSYHENVCEEFFEFPQLPSRPNITVTKKYGGWNMNPSNVYFGNGQYDPWIAFTVASTEPGSPMRKMTQTVPECGVPPPKNEVFGVVYPDSVHVSDLSMTRGTAGTSFKTGLKIFSEALEEWLKCFKPS